MAVSCFVAGFSYLLWKVLLYPKLVSPLRHLPQPKAGHWLHGQLWNVFESGINVAILEWYVLPVSLK